MWRNYWEWWQKSSFSADLIDAINVSLSTCIMIHWLVVHVDDVTIVLFIGPVLLALTLLFLWFYSGYIAGETYYESPTPYCINTNLWLKSHTVNNTMHVHVHIISYRTQLHWYNLMWFVKLFNKPLWKNTD